MPEDTPDFGWYERLLLDDILPRWLDAAPTDEGLFHNQLDRRWRPVGEPVATAVAQTRLLYNFAKGYDLTGDDRYLRAVESGARFLVDKFRDPEHGGWFHAVGPGGVVLDDHKDAYDLAFFVFGLAHAARVTGDAAFRGAMLEAWTLLDTRFRDQHGGFMRRLTRDFRPDEQRRTQNPTMHLFEALLAASEVEPGLGDEALRLGKFVLNRLVRWDGQPCLPEYFDLAWRPLPEGRGGLVCLGHQFEWAWLFSHAVEKGLPGWWVAPATDLLQFGLRVGFDEDGGVMSSATPEGKVLSARKGWWEPCEANRALLHHAVLRDREDLWPAARKAAEFVRTRCVDAECGGWYSNLEETPTDDRPHKGGGAKVDYHVVGMCVEAIRLRPALEGG
jgi:mannose-6-phosphate isomerase